MALLAGGIPRRFGGPEAREAPRFHRYEWEQVHDTEAYVDLLLTCSNHIALPHRAELIADIRQLIDERHRGRVVKRYLTQLAVARKR